MVNFDYLEICPGYGKDGTRESFNSIKLCAGELYTVVGNTGSGKSRLIKDIEQFAKRDSVTGRTILLNGQIVESSRRQSLAISLIAHLSQNMRFSLDVSVEQFISQHLKIRGRDSSLVKEVVELACNISFEPFTATSNLHELSGGQSRALMIADIALVCNSPIVLIDEIENAGINKENALAILTNYEKLVMIATHDVQTALMAEQRIVISGGMVVGIVKRTDAELAYYQELKQLNRQQSMEQKILRNGGTVR